MCKLVTIVIPVFNLSKSILHSLESVDGQTYDDIELIIVDDGSIDDSINTANEYLKKTSISYRIIKQPNCGPSAARNVGAFAAKGEWVLCLDGDDFIVPETIEEMVGIARSRGVDCVFCNYKCVDDSTIKCASNRRGEAMVLCADTMRTMFLKRKIVPIVPGMLLKRTVFDKVRFDEECRYCEDTLFLWELFYHLDKFVFINSDLYNYYRREGSTMHSLKPEKYLSSSPRHRISAERILRTHPDDKIAKMIYPKFRLAGLRIICRNNSYDVFKKTVMDDGKNAYIKSLLKQPNLKLFVYALLFLLSKRLFYLISK